MSKIKLWENTHFDKIIAVYDDGTEEEIGYINDAGEKIYYGSTSTATPPKKFRSDWNNRQYDAYKQRINNAQNNNERSPDFATLLHKQNNNILNGAGNLLAQLQQRQQLKNTRRYGSAGYGMSDNDISNSLLFPITPFSNKFSSLFPYNSFDENTINSEDFEGKFISNTHENPFINELLKRVSKYVVNRLMQSIHNTTKSIIDIADRNFNPLTIYFNIINPYSNLPEWQAKSLRKHYKIAIHADEFITTIKGLSKMEIKRQTEGQGWFKSQSGGPSARFVLDPANHERVIDMRHFLSVGDMGEAIGLGIEVMQSTREEWRSSAYDLQDFYSNNLGQQFYESGFYQQYKSGKVDFPTALDNFFKHRAK